MPDFHKKAVFFDADGTICDIEKGTPASAVEAITKLVNNGHEAWLCTGRSRSFVPDYLEKIPFTGMITACGCTIEKNGEPFQQGDDSAAGMAFCGGAAQIRHGSGDGRRGFYVL